jgi:hypothetical protein
MRVVRRDHAERAQAGYDRWPLLRHRRTPTSILPDIAKQRAVSRKAIASGLRDHILVVIKRLYTQLGSCVARARRRGASGGRGAVGGAVSAGRIPRGTPPQLGATGRDSHQDTGTQTSTFSVNTQPNHVLPLVHFGAISDVRDGGVVRNYHHCAGERSGGTQQYDLNEGPPCCICWWLVKPITGQAPPTAATLE